MHIVKFLESEIGWGGEIWFVGYDTLKDAMEAVQLCNKGLSRTTTPNNYIVAEYYDEMDSVPKGYKV